MVGISSLNPNQQYKLRDSSEVCWKFVYEAIAGRLGWWGWYKAPGMSKYLCMGVYSAEDVERRVGEHALRLTDDDRIDLHLFLKNWNLPLDREVQGLSE